eukprot:758644-Hanusia_phi.AAC.3
MTIEADPGEGRTQEGKREEQGGEKTEGGGRGQEGRAGIGNLFFGKLSIAERGRDRMLAALEVEVDDSPVEALPHAVSSFCSLPLHLQHKERVSSGFNQQLPAQHELLVDDAEQQVEALLFLLHVDRERVKLLHRHAVLRLERRQHRPVQLHFALLGPRDHHHLYRHRHRLHLLLPSPVRLHPRGLGKLLSRVLGEARCSDKMLHPGVDVELVEADKENVAVALPPLALL